MKILTIGGAMRDLFIHYKDKEFIHLTLGQKKQTFILLEEGKKIEADALDYYTGGGAINAAVSLQRLGIDATVFAKLGNDADGDAIIQSLKRDQVNTSALVTTDQERTGISFIIPCPSGDRTLLLYRGANLTISEKELPYEAIKKVDHLYITSLSGKSAQLLVPIVKAAHQYNIPVATNPGTSQLQADAFSLRQALPLIDILILNSYEAKLLMVAFLQENEELKSKVLQTDPYSSEPHKPQLLQTPITFQSICFNLHHFFHAVFEAGPRIVVVTNGAEGVYVATQKEMLFHPSIPAKVVNTLGAGDAFGSCFVARIAQGYSVEDAMIHGLLNSASVVSYLDTQTGLLTSDELKKRAQEIDKKQMQRFET